MLTLRNLFERNVASLLLPLFNLGISDTTLLLFTCAWQRARGPRAALQPVRSQACPDGCSGAH